MSKKIQMNIRFGKDENLQFKKDLFIVISESDTAYFFTEPKRRG